MRAYTVHAPPGDPAPERFAFVKDGFSWPAILVPLLWILWHRMWLALIGYLVFVAAVTLTGYFVGDPYATLFGIAGDLILGFEGNAIRRLSLERRGFREIGEAAGRNLTEAEIRFFGEWAGLPAAAQHDLLARAPHAATEDLRASEEPILGLFPEPER